MKKENKFILINLAIFRCHCVVTWEQDVKEIVKWAKKHDVNSLKEDWVQTFNETTKVANGLCIDLGLGNTDILVWLKEKPKKMSQYGVLYHELYHAVDKIAEDHAMQTKETEARAYIFEYLTNECNKVLWK
jgi:hypothetical protein